MTEPYERNGQWYGSAPCGCTRLTDPWFAKTCVVHDTGLCAWEAAAAIQAGLRAIAEWRAPVPFPYLFKEGEYRPALPCRWIDQAEALIEYPNEVVVRESWHLAPEKPGYLGTITLPVELWDGREVCITDFDDWSICTDAVSDDDAAQKDWRRDQLTGDWVYTMSPDSTDEHYFVRLSEKTVKVFIYDIEDLDLPDALQLAAIACLERAFEALRGPAGAFLANKRRECEALEARAQEADRRNDEFMRDRAHSRARARCYSCGAAVPCREHTQPEDW